MTYDQMKALQRGCPPFVICGFSGSVSSYQRYVEPAPEDKMAHAKQEKSDTVFNGLSLEQVQGVTKYRNMDALHKADAVAADLGRAERLMTEAKTIGASAFMSRRLSKK